MRRRPSPDHQEAVARRLALLSAELAAVREPVPEAWDDPAAGEGDWTSPHTRIATRPRAPLYAVPDQPESPQPHPEEPQPGQPEPPASEPPALPVPGRHAARRPGRLLTAALPDTLGGRIALGSSQVAVLAVIVAVGLAVTCWWVVRGRPHEVTAPVEASPAAALASLPSGSPGAGGAEAGSPAAPVAASSGAAAGAVTVDVEGRVRRPGIVVLDAGARVVDALERAGGARPGVDLTGLNLARVLVDGEQILVGVPGTPAAVPPPAPSPGVPGGPLVNLNTASEAELEALPDVGPVTAQSILAWRDEHGGFSSVNELLEVDGIGDATLSKLAPLVTV